MKHHLYFYRKQQAAANSGATCMFFCLTYNGFKYRRKGAAALQKPLFPFFFLYVQITLETDSGALMKNPIKGRLLARNAVIFASFETRRAN